MRFFVLTKDQDDDQYIIISYNFINISVPCVCMYVTKRFLTLDEVTERHKIYIAETT